MAYKVLFTADLHGNKDFYELLIKKAKDPKIKAVILGGDLGPRGGDTIKDWVDLQRDFFKHYFIPELSKLDKEVFFIMGNDDLRKNEEVFLHGLPEKLHYVHMECISIHDKNLVGYSFINPTPFRLKDWEKPEDEKGHSPTQMFDEEILTVEKEEGTLKEDFDKIKTMSDAKKTIYVAHAPPFDTKLDIITDGTHVGSKPLRNFIEKEQPLLTLHGHIHESPKVSESWKDKIGNTICINVGSSYPEIKLNYAIIDLDDLSVEYGEVD